MELTLTQSKYASLCFSVAQMIAFLSSTDSTCSRCEITDITCCITEHISVNCNCVQTCKLLFEECINREFGFTVSEFIYSLHGEEYVRALFGLDPNLERLLQGKIYMFFNVVALFLHDAWTCYRYHM